ncbi:hypothetical protein [Frankia sp. CcI49]|nr:hypothetical protein [Frankia sp. CcI49]
MERTSPDAIAETSRAISLAAGDLVGLMLTKYFSVPLHVSFW